MRPIRLFLSDIKELLEAREFPSARTALRMIGPVDLADGWEHFTPEERQVLFKLSPRQRALQLFEELDPPHQEELLQALRTEEVQELVQDLGPAETGRVLRGMPKPMVRQLEAILKKGRMAERVEGYLRFHAGSVGALMRTNHFAIEPRLSCRQALERVSLGTRLRHIENTYLDTLFVVGADGRLAGAVTLKELLVAPADMLVKDLMNPEPRTLTPDMDQEVAALLFKRYKLSAAAVLDIERKILGVVLDKDILQVLQEEAEEDIAKMAGVQAGLLSASLGRVTAVRLPWLLASCLGYIVVSRVIHHFEGVLSSVIALTTFMPLIAAMGGNVGSQTATVVIRGMATGEVDRIGFWPIVLKELGVGGILGAAYGAGMGAVAHGLYGARFGPSFSLVIASGMMASMTTAALLGAVEPFVFRRFSIDPATAAGPLITCLADMVSTASYLALASYLLLG